MAPDYVATCADNLLIACQIESAKAVGNIDEILAVDDIDLDIGGRRIVGVQGWLQIACGLLVNAAGVITNGLEPNVTP